MVIELKQCDQCVDKAVDGSRRVALRNRKFLKQYVPVVVEKSRARILPYDPLEKLKILMSEAPVMCFYEYAMEITVQCHASQKCLGTTLLEEGKPLAFDSRALTDTETRYAQIEKEMLAVVWSLEKFNQYTYGRKENVVSDQKHFECILKEALANALKCLHDDATAEIRCRLDVSAWKKSSLGRHTFASISANY